MRRSSKRFGFLLTAPAMLVLGGLLLIPAVLTLDYSFRTNELSGQGVGAFVGIDNYLTIFKAPIFYESLKVTVLFAVGFVVVSTVGGLAVALLLNQTFRGRWLARALLVLPWACPWLVIGIMWNRFATGSGTGSLAWALTKLHLVSPTSSLLADPLHALVVVILAASWRQVCFAGILFLAGLQTLPPEILEASQMDGAGVFQRFRHVTLPWIRPVLATVTLLNVIYGFFQFDLIYALTRGGPGTATETLSLLIYDSMFNNSHIGTGSALSVILALVSLLGGLLVIRLVTPRAD